MPRCAAVCPGVWCVCEDDEVKQQRREGRRRQDEHELEDERPWRRWLGMETNVGYQHRKTRGEW